MAQQYFYDKQIRRYIQQFIRLFAGFNVQMGKDENNLPVYQQVPVRYGDINRMAAHITRENSENVVNSVPFISCYVTALNMLPNISNCKKKKDRTVQNWKSYAGDMRCHICCKRFRCMDIKHNQKLQLLFNLVLFNPTLILNK